MDMTAADNEEPAETALAEASDWMFRMAAAPDDTSLRKALDTWLAADTAHAEAFLLAERAWRLSGETPPAFAAFWQESPRQSRQSRQSRRTRQRRSGTDRTAAPRRIVGLAAAAAAAILAMFAPTIALHLSADHVTGTGERRMIRLEDGSRVMLSGASAIVTDFRRDQRSITLAEGQAFFDVRRNIERPFVVRAAGMEVTVTGTAFDVDITPATLSVALAHGSVAVGHGGAPQARLKPGERLDIDRATGKMTLGAVSQPEIGAWRSGRLAVRGARFGDVAATLDRGFRGRIIVTDAFAAKRVTGVFDLSNPEQALDVLGRPYGAKVHKLTPWILIVTAT